MQQGPEWDELRALARRGSRSTHTEDRSEGEESSVVPRKARPLPRPFSFHWGGGQIVEEATMIGEWNEPTIQLLEYDDGSLSVRFCSYSHRGGFQRGSLMVGDNEMQGLKAALNATPRLRALLKKMVD